MRRGSDKIPSMLKLWRRHTPKCPHRAKGRDYLSCRCPIWADGELDGERYRKTLKTRDLQRALKKQALLESPDGPRLKPVDEAVKAFLAHYEQHLEESTLRKYRLRLEKNLLPFCEQAGIGSLAEITVETLDDFRAGRKLAKTTSTKELQTLRQFFSFCVERKWIAENIAKKIKAPSNVKPEPVVPYTADEMARMLSACDQIGQNAYERMRARAMLLLLRYTGLRISDVAMLEKSRIGAGAILLQTQKTGGTVYLPIPAELEQALNSVPTPRGAGIDCTYFFTNGSGSKRTAVSVIERCLRAVFRKSGVIDAHAHRFRHTLATDVLVKGGSEQDVADILGISPNIVRKHYQKWTQARQDRITTLMQNVHSSGTFLAQTEKRSVIQ